MQIEFIGIQESIFPVVSPATHSKHTVAWRWCAISAN